MSTRTFLKQAELWGKTYEILVKRGVLTQLVEAAVIPADHPVLKIWNNTQLTKVSSALMRELEVLDERERVRLNAAFDHLALVAFGLGYTVTRAYLKPYRMAMQNGRLKLRGIWCPLTLPGENNALSEQRQEQAIKFCEALKLRPTFSAHLYQKGQPANADFLLWLSGNTETEYLLIQEYAFDMPGTWGDFNTQAAHLNELLNYQRRIESRSVFANVTAQLNDEHFDLSNELYQHLTALSGTDKPLYKLCQACAYAESLSKILSNHQETPRSVMTRALAITPHGLESLAARFDHLHSDPRCKLMAHLGKAYHRAEKLRDEDPQELIEKVEQVFHSIRHKLPASLQTSMRDLMKPPAPGDNYHFKFEETLTDFMNPAELIPLQTVRALIDDTPRLNDYFQGSARTAILTELQRMGEAPQVSLRDLHAAAIHAGLRSARARQLNIMALEGNPGIGKTTAVRTYLSQMEQGFLFFYLSPRIIINREVTADLAQAQNLNNRYGDTLTLTSNARLNMDANAFYQAQVSEGKARQRSIKSAVVFDGVKNLHYPEFSSVLFLTPEEELKIDSYFASTGYKKHTLSESEDHITDLAQTGVLRGLAQSLRELLPCNPQLKRVAMTMALQGFREQDKGNTTIQGLSNLFQNKASTLSGQKERAQFAAQLPQILVMVDELTGTGVGAPFVHAIARWLESEFIEIFDREACPFTVTLIIADASLVNNLVFKRYLEAGEPTPDKILISRADTVSYFHIAADEVRIGGVLRPTLHVMTNSFPASQLSIRYQTRFTTVQLMLKKNGELELPRQAIQRAAKEVTLNSACFEIFHAIESAATQVIYFAQDKQFLGELRAQLIACKNPQLTQNEIAILDGSVPAWKRKKLMEPACRDTIKVFLMTSAGARGVSFPLTDWIIVTVPRFNIEIALMEIAQIVYRGRGTYYDTQNRTTSKDQTRRHLVFHINEFNVYQEQGVDLKQWLRRSIDLMTLLVMLRATLYTRITGAAGLRQAIALVPVGGTHVSKSLDSRMSEKVEAFVREADIYLYRQHESSQLKDLLFATKNQVIEYFSCSGLKNTPEKGYDGRTLAKPHTLEVLHTTLTDRLAPLLLCAQAVPQSAHRLLPDHVFFAGPMIIEHWAHFVKQEFFDFENVTAIHSLLKQLAAIEKEHEFPSNLRNPAAHLRKLLARKTELAHKAFTVAKSLNSPHTWVGLAAGYHQFMLANHHLTHESFQLENAKQWRYALRDTLALHKGLIPPLPYYESFPWVAGVKALDPLNLEQIFDDRYFMASHELNLLNTLLMNA